MNVINLDDMRKEKVKPHLVWVCACGGFEYIYYLDHGLVCNECYGVLQLPKGHDMAKSQASVKAIKKAEVKKVANKAGKKGLKKQIKKPMMVKNT